MRGRAAVVATTRPCCAALVVGCAVACAAPSRAAPPGIATHAHPRARCTAGLPVAAAHRLGQLAVLGAVRAWVGSGGGLFRRFPVCADLPARRQLARGQGAPAGGAAQKEARQRGAAAATAGGALRSGGAVAANWQPPHPTPHPPLLPPSLLPPVSTMRRSMELTPSAAQQCPGRPQRPRAPSSPPRRRASRCGGWPAPEQTSV